MTHAQGPRCRKRPRLWPAYRKRTIQVTDKQITQDYTPLTSRVKAYGLLSMCATSEDACGSIRAIAIGDISKQFIARYPF
jgi:hypothetical protein